MVFANEESAARAIEEIQGFPLFNKPIVLEFAKTKSDAIVQQSGDAEEFELHKRRRLAEKGMRGTVALSQERLTNTSMQNENKHKNN